MLPNFFVVGAEKAGTTSMYRYLDAHDDVYMSPVKEPLYFALDPERPKAVDPNWPYTATIARDRASYERLFDGVTTETAIGEASTGYLNTTRAAHRIADEVPGARIIVLLRDPSDRALSAHRMYTSLGLDTETDFARAIDRELAGGTRYTYVRIGFYTGDVNRYLERFGRDRVKILLYEDLGSAPTATMADVYAFLGVRSDFVPDTTARFNVATVPRSVRFQQFTKGGSAAKSALKRVLPASVRATLKQRALDWNATAPEAIDPEIRQRLVALYADDISLLEELIGRDLSAWKQA